MGTGRREVVRAAIQLERDGQDFYLKAAAEASNELGREMLRSFADDEQRHIEWLEAIVEGNVPETEPPQEIYDRLSGIFADAPDELRQAASGSSDDIDAIQVAIGMEDKSVAAYEKWAKDAEDEDIRELCGELAEFERLHRRILENTIEYLESTGDWFMQEEGWIFDGG